MATIIFCSSDRSRPESGGPTRSGGKCTSRDVVHPLVVGLGPRFGMMRVLPVSTASMAFSASGLALTNHWRGEVGLHDGLAAVAVAHAVPMGIDPFQQSLGLSAVDHGLAAGKPVHALEPAGCIGHGAVVGDDLDAGQVVALPMSKSLGSWAGVTFRAPVPNDRST
jgi:hypothetical protein